MSEKVITDYFGRVIGVEKKDGNKTTVTTWTGKVLGTADKSGTSDFAGKKISPQNVPDILIKREDT